MDRRPSGAESNPAPARANARSPNLHATSASPLRRCHSHLLDRQIQHRQHTPLRPTLLPSTASSSSSLCHWRAAARPAHYRMAYNVDDLLDLLDLEPLEVNIYRGKNRDIGSGRVFGAQVLSQALVAAQRTVEEDRVAHSV